MSDPNLEVLQARIKRLERSRMFFTGLFAAFALLFVGFVVSGKQIVTQFVTDVVEAHELTLTDLKVMRGESRRIMNHIASIRASHKHLDNMLVNDDTMVIKGDLTVSGSIKVPAIQLDNGSASQGITVMKSEDGKEYLLLANALLVRSETDDSFVRLQTIDRGEGGRGEISALDKNYQSSDAVKLHGTNFISSSL